MPSCKVCQDKAVAMGYYIYCKKHTQAMYDNKLRGTLHALCKNVARNICVDKFIHYNIPIYAWIPLENIIYQIDSDGTMYLTDKCAGCTYHADKYSELNTTKSLLQEQQKLEESLLNIRHDIELISSTINKTLITVKNTLHSTKRLYSSLSSEYEDISILKTWKDSFIQNKRSRIERSVIDRNVLSPIVEPLNTTLINRLMLQQLGNFLIEAKNNNTLEEGEISKHLM